MLENYLAMGLLNGLALATLGYMAHQNDGIEWRRKRFYLLAVATTAVMVLAEMGTALVEGGALSSRALYVACNAVGFTLTPAIPLLLALVFEGEAPRSLGLWLLPLFVNAALSLLSPAFGFIFSVSADNAYQRGSLFAAFVVAYGCGVLALVKATLDTGSRYRYRLRSKFFALVGFAILGTSVQLVVPAVHATWTCVTMTLALHYGFVCEFHNELDPLTKLYNRKCYDSEIARMARKKRCAVVLMDVDNFKGVNDRYGHPYGDQSLAVLASLVHDSFHRIGVCYRIGGDEFCVLCGAADAGKISAALERLSNGIQQHRDRDPRLPMLSCGWRVCDEEGEPDVFQAVQAADRQMYENKARNKASD